MLADVVGVSFGWMIARVHSPIGLNGAYLKAFNSAVVETYGMKIMQAAPKGIFMSPPLVGSRLTSNLCSFTVWSPLRNSIELLFLDGRLQPMDRDDHGYWSARLAGIDPGTRYKYRLDGSLTLPDPASRSQPDGVHGFSEVVATDYTWTDDSWKGLALGEMVIYELHVGTFTQSRDFNGIIQGLPYLQKLGINAIEIMPVAQFPGTRNWGYDGVFPFAVQNSYGGINGLKALVDAAHAAGIAIILDVVYNHQGPEGNYLGEYGPYFTDKYKTGWGKAINFDDAWCDGVRNFYLQNALMWLDEFRIDGLRLDAVHAIWDFSARPFIEELAASVRALEATTGRKKVLIAEFDLNNPRYILPQSSGGYGLDGQWVDEFHHAIHALVTGEVDGYYEDFGSVEHIRRTMTDAYVYTGQYSVHRKKHFGREPEGTSPGQFVVFAQNHDQVGNRMLGDRLSSLLSTEDLRLVAASYLLSPYVPMLFMGEEYGEQNPFQYFISHGDKDLVEAVRKGRKEEFAYFKWQGEVPDPQAEETFSRCILSWSVEHDDVAREMFRYYKFLIHFRKTRTPLRADGMVNLDGEMIIMERGRDNDRLLILLNFGKQSRSYTLPGRSRQLLDSSLEQSFDKTYEYESPKLTIDVAPRAAMVFEYY